MCACVFFINGKNCIRICLRKQYSLCDSLASFQWMLSVALSLIHLSSLQDFLSPKRWNGRFAMDMPKTGFVQILQNHPLPVLLQKKRNKARLSAGNFVSIFDKSKLLHAAKVKPKGMRYRIVFQIQSYLDTSLCMHIK